MNDCICIFSAIVQVACLYFNLFHLKIGRTAQVHFQRSELSISSRTQAGPLQAIISEQVFLRQKMRLEVILISHERYFLK